MKMLKTKDFEIAANVVGNDASPRLALLLPGRLDSKDYANFTSHAEYLSERGFLVVAIDAPGTWDSPEDLQNYTTSTYIEVVNQVIDYFGNRPTLLLGHSRGGAVTMLASANPAVIAIVMVNAAYDAPSPPQPGEIENGFLPEYRDLPPGNVRTKDQRRYDLPLIYFEDGAKHKPTEALKNFNGPKLLVHALHDEFTALGEVKAIYESLSEPKMFLEIDCTHDYRLFPEVIANVNEQLGQFVDLFLK